MLIVEIHLTGDNSDNQLTTPVLGSELNGWRHFDSWYKSYKGILGWQSYLDDQIANLKYYLSRREREMMRQESRPRPEGGEECVVLKEEWARVIRASVERYDLDKTAPTFRHVADKRSWITLNLNEV